MVNLTDSLVNKNVDFHAYCPGFVSTKLTGHIQPKSPQRSKFIVLLRKFTNIEVRPGDSGLNRLLKKEFKIGESMKEFSQEL